MPIIAGNYLQEDTILPRVFLQKIATSVLQEHSCVSREEESLFQFRIYTTSSDECEDFIEQIRSIYDYTRLNVSNVQVEATQYLNHSIMESEAGIWQGMVDYVVTALRSLTNNHDLTTTSGLTLRNAIKNRYLSNIPLKSVLSNFVTGSQLEGTIKPYCCLTNYDLAFNSANTQGIIESGFLTFDIYEKTLESLENIMEKFMLCYDYARFALPYNSLYFGYSNDTIVEEEPNLWHASMVYNIMTEREINVN